MNVLKIIFDRKKVLSVRLLAILSLVPSLITILAIATNLLLGSDSQLDSFIPFFMLYSLVHFQIINIHLKQNQVKR